MKKSIKNKNMYIALALIGLSSFGCAGKNAALKEAHQNFEGVANNPDIVRGAPVALHEAKQTLNKADKLSKQTKNNDEVTHLAKLANKKIEIAKVTADEQSYMTQIGKTARSRSDVVLESRTRDLDAANKRATTASTMTKEAEDRAREAQAQSEMSQSELKRSADREAKLKAELAGLKAKETEIGTQLTLRDMMFEVGKSDLTTGGIRDVRKIAEIAKEHPQREIVIEGHTDSMGSDEYNMELSQKRASSIESILKSSQNVPNKITTKGYGKTFPIASNKTNAGRQLNRRVVVTLLHEGKQASDLENSNNDRM